MKKIITLIILFIGLNSIAQNKFEKGYFTTIDGNKTECLIKNEDWRQIPSQFQFKLTDKSEVKKIQSNQLNVLEIYNKFLFEKHKVDINKYSNNLNNLSNKRVSIFKNKNLFLKVIIKGKASLFKYSDNGVDYFFYSINSKIKPLEYKKYKNNKGGISENLNYQKTLRDELNCKNINSNIKYREDSFINFFSKFNSCSNSSNKLYIKKNRKGKFNIYGKIGFGLSLLDFTSTPAINLGLELEYIFPFNNNKWSLFTEPTYQSAFKTINIDVVTGYTLYAPPSNPNAMVNLPIYSNEKVKYSSLEIPIAIRHYLFLNNKKVLFINSGINLDFPIKFNEKETKMNKNISFLLGIGYHFNNKLSIEARYNAPKKITSESNTEYPNIQSFMIKLGYSFN
ncbi:PorT family protein [Polaribacter sp. AHE13PA]|jgi:hypothetical protein|uniref:PorT family protein n=1 Tax=Polaribacter sp. AHE13PA TaxID=2745562 RepID=UPI001C4FED91|nr:PorT family protein [Polaribacter sp. AHE13PA]QXP68413.1 outer membrane beta-barrel protein [Polaribacter sp. AHE13PA]